MKLKIMFMREAEGVSLIETVELGRDSNLNSEGDVDYYITKNSWGDLEE